MIDLDKLERLAKSATPGPWAVDTECLDDRGCLYVAKGQSGRLLGRILEVFRNCLVRDKQQRANAEYIAAVNPAAILALIAEARALRKDAERYRWLREGNAYGPEENSIRGGDELDEYCDACIGTGRGVK